MAESMLEATLQYNSGQVKPQVPPGYMHFLLLFGTIYNISVFVQFHAINNELPGEW